MPDPTRTPWSSRLVRRACDRDARHAAEVAAALAADPADERSLEDWGRRVGASARTLARAFVDDLGMGFARYRTQVRLRAALDLLADGLPIAAVAHRVGYRSASAFIVAFRRTTGVSPGAYFAQADDPDAAA